MHRIHAFLALAVFATGCPVEPTFPDAESAGANDRAHEAEVRALLQPAVEGEWVAGIVVGLVSPSGVETYGLGGASDSAPEPPDERTVFEIGSLTKVFTALLLADLVGRGEVALDQPVAELLPDGSAPALSQDPPVTLRHLAMHTSGLPRMPDNWNPADTRQPYVGYGEALLLEFLRGWTRAREPGETYEYSNLGAGLLGYAIARSAGATYEDLVRARVTTPLALDDTTIALDEDQARRLAQPHDVDGRPVPPWDFDVLAPCGALRSTLADLACLVQAALAAPLGPLGPALASMLNVRHPAEDGEVALGWHVSASGVVWHNGGTGGSHAYVGFDRQRGFGVIVLANTGTFLVVRIGEALLELLAGRPATLALPPTVQVPEETLASYVGTYDLAEAGELVVTLEDGRLWARITGQDAYRLFPSGDAEFAWRVVPASVTFRVGPDGTVDAAVLHADGVDTTASRRR